MRHSLTFAAILAFLLTTQGVAEERNTGALRNELTGTLSKYIKALQEGDVQTYRELRESDSLKRVTEFLAKEGRELSPATIKPRNPKAFTRLASYPVIETIQKGEYARIVLLNENAAEMGHKVTEVEIVFVMFKKEADTWKFVRFGPLVIGKTELTKDKQFPEDKVPAPFRMPM
jgi:hypothetical protein